jgi:triosephosphate isomerase
MRKKYIIGNWKMNLSKKEALSLVKETISVVDGNVKANIVFAPSFIFLNEISDLCKIKSCFSVSAQDCSSNELGAFTGEVSSKMISSTGVSYVIIGHSERRSNFKETDEILNLKIQQALKNKLQIIFCCGETLEQRENDSYLDIISAQLSNTIFKLGVDSFKNIIIAYEPIWAIGTGKTASSLQAQEMHAYIRSLISNNFDKNISDNTSVIYGGSCKPSNAKEIFEQDDIDGGLIGGASLNSSDFISLINLF